MSYMLYECAVEFTLCPLLHACLSNSQSAAGSAARVVFQEDKGASNLLYGNSFEALDERFPWQQLTETWELLLLGDMLSISAGYYRMTHVMTCPHIVGSYGGFTLSTGMLRKGNVENKIY